MVTTRYIKVTNLQKNCSESDIHNLFNKFGYIENLELFDYNGFFYFIISFMDIKSASRAYVSDIFFHGSKLKMEYYDPSGKVGLQFLDKNQRFKNQRYLYEKESSLSLNGKTDQYHSVIEKRQNSNQSDNNYPVSHRGLKISRLPPQKTEDQIRQGLTAEFRRYGRIASILVIHDKNSSTNGNRAAILTFRRKEDACRAYQSTRSGEKVIFATRAMIEPHFGLPTVDSQECSSPSSSSSSAASPITNASSQHGNDDRDINTKTPLKNSSVNSCSSSLLRKSSSLKSDDLENDKKFTNDGRLLLTGSNATSTLHNINSSTPNINGSILMNNNNSNNHSANTIGFNSITRTLYIAGLTRTNQGPVSREQLTTAFRKFGEIEHVQMRPESNTAFLQFSEMRGPLRAMTAHSRDPLKLGGRLLKLAYVPSIPSTCLWIADLPPKLAQLTDSCLFNKFQTISPISEIVLIFRNADSPDNGSTLNNNNNLGKNSQTAAFIKVPSVTDASSLLKELRTKETLTKFLSSLNGKYAGDSQKSNIRPLSVDYAGQRQCNLVSTLKSQKNGNLLKSSNMNYLRQNQIRVISSNTQSPAFSPKNFTTSNDSNNLSTNFTPLSVDVRRSSIAESPSATSTPLHQKMSEKSLEDSRWKAASQCKLTNPIIKTVSSMNHAKKPTQLSLSQSSLSSGSYYENHSNTNKKFRSSSTSSSSSSTNSTDFIGSPSLVRKTTTSPTVAAKKTKLISQNSIKSKSLHTTHEKCLATSSSTSTMNAMRKNLSQLKEDLNSARNSITSSINETSRLFSPVRNDSETDNYESMYDKIKRRNQTSEKEKKRKKSSSKKKKKKLKEESPSYLSLKIGSSSSSIKEKNRSNHSPLIRRSLGISFPVKADETFSASLLSDENSGADTKKSKKHKFYSDSTDEDDDENDDGIDLKPKGSIFNKTFSSSHVKSKKSETKIPKKTLSTSSSSSSIDISMKRKPEKLSLLTSSNSNRKRSNKTSMDRHKSSKKQRLSTSLTTSSSSMKTSGPTSLKKKKSLKSSRNSSQQMSNSFEALLNPNYSDTKEGPGFIKYAKSLQSSVFFRRLQQQQLSHDEDVTFEDLNDDEFERLSAATPSTEPMENDDAMSSSQEEEALFEDNNENDESIQIDRQSFISDTDEKPSPTRNPFEDMGMGELWRGMETPTKYSPKVDPKKENDEPMFEEKVIPKREIKTSPVYKEEEISLTTSSFLDKNFIQDDQNKFRFKSNLNSQDQSGELKSSPSVSSSSPSSAAIASSKWDNIGNISISFSEGNSSSETVHSPQHHEALKDSASKLEIQESVDKKTIVPIIPQQQRSCQSRNPEPTKVILPSNEELTPVKPILAEQTTVMSKPPLNPSTISNKSTVISPEVLSNRIIQDLKIATTSIVESPPQYLPNLPQSPIISKTSTNIKSTLPQINLAGSKPLSSSPIIGKQYSKGSATAQTSLANSTPQTLPQQVLPINQSSHSTQGHRWSSRCNVDSTVEGAIIGDVQNYVRGVIERVTAESCSSTSNSNPSSTSTTMSSSKKNNFNSSGTSTGSNSSVATSKKVESSLSQPTPTLPLIESATIQIPGVNACITPKALGSSDQSKKAADPYELNFDEPSITKMSTVPTSTIISVPPTATVATTSCVEPVKQAMSIINPLNSSTTVCQKVQKETVDNVIRDVVAGKFDAQSYLDSWRNKSNPATILSPSNNFGNQSVTNSSQINTDPNVDTKSNCKNSMKPTTDAVIASTSTSSSTVNQTNTTTVNSANSNKTKPISTNSTSVVASSTNASNNNIVSMIIDALKSLPGLQVHTVGNDFLLSNSSASDLTSATLATNQLLKDSQTSVTNMTLPLVHGNKIPPSATISATTITLPVTAAAAGIKNLQAVMMQQQQQQLQNKKNQISTSQPSQNQFPNTPLSKKTHVTSLSTIPNSSTYVKNFDEAKTSKNILSILSNLQQNSTPHSNLPDNQQVSSTTFPSTNSTLSSARKSNQTPTITTPFYLNNQAPSSNNNVFQSNKTNVAQCTKDSCDINAVVNSTTVVTAVNQQFANFIQPASRNQSSSIPLSNTPPPNPSRSNLSSPLANVNNPRPSSCHQQAPQQPSLLLKNLSERLLNQDPANLHLMMNLIQTMANSNPENKASNITNEALLMHTLQTFMSTAPQTPGVNAANQASTNQPPNGNPSQKQTYPSAKQQSMDKLASHVNSGGPTNSDILLNNLISPATVGTAKSTQQINSNTLLYPTCGPSLTSPTTNATQNVNKGPAKSQPTTITQDQISNPSNTATANPSSSNDSNQLERIVQDYPFVWQGRLSLKNSEAHVALHYIHGNINLLNNCMKLLATLTKSLSTDTEMMMDAPLKIVQRMRMEPPQLEAVHRKMSQDGDYCACLALASGKNPEDLCHQTQILSHGFIRYMQEKGAAGIINACLPDQQSEGQYIVHIFPPCEFSFNKLAASAPALYQSVMKKDIPHLLVVITTV